MKVEFAELYLRVIENINVCTFFRDHGYLISADAQPDTVGWIEAKKDGKTFHIMLNTKDGNCKGDWKDEEGKVKNIADLVILTNGLRENDENGKGGDYEGALRILQENTLKTLPHLACLDNPENADLKVKVPLTITGDYKAIYDVPISYRVKHCQHKGCQKCVDHIFTVRGNADELIESCGASRTQIDHIFQRHSCDKGWKPVIEILTKCAIREAICTQHSERLVDRSGSDAPDRKVEIDGIQQRAIERQIYIRLSEKSTNLTQPRSYMATGYARTDPRNSQRTLLVEKLEPIYEPYEKFEYKQHLDELLEIKALGSKTIIKDLVEHRTHIYGRDELMTIVLLTYCSPLHIHFNGQHMRGWINAGIVGDTAVGKTTTWEVMSDLIGAGDIFSCQSGRRTGLTFALSRRKEGAFRCQAGMLPRASRKILCVEETQDLPLDDLNSLRVPMDSGVLKVDYSDSAMYETKTRLILNFNPRNGRTLDSYTFGCVALKDLVPYPQVIRRLDIVAFLRKFEIPADANRIIDNTVKPLVSPAALRALVFYAWKLTADQVVFAAETTALIMQRTRELADEYGDAGDVPLVYPESHRNVMARLSAAWAVLDLSSDDQLATIVVRPEHVENVTRFLRYLYSHPHCALNRYSEQWKRVKTLSDYEPIAKEIMRRLDAGGTDALRGQSPFARLLSCLYLGASLNREGLLAQINCKRITLDDGVNYLLSVHLLHRERHQLIPTGKYTSFCSKFQKDHPLHWQMVNMSNQSMKVTGDKK